MRGALPTDPADVVRSLAAALPPLQPSYPMPFFRLAA
jgi:hypothetical protein